MKNKNSQRGFSIAELLTVSVICGMLMTAMVLMAPVVLKAPRQVQSQVDDVNTAAIALYKIRRDLGQSDTTGVLGCTTSPVACASYTSPQNVGGLVVATADDGTGQFHVADQFSLHPGYPDWRGVWVYWLAPNADGSAFDIMRAYIAEGKGVIPQGPNGVPQLSTATAQTALTAAMLITPTPVLANYIKTISVGVDTTTN
ncbi:MAG: hypothetical protein M3Z37_09335, partial [Candidatus Eremiobacteraeota bacterium]|nr:hypothetical protein [Candidatus Eremiobacteraeota bacterium]